MKSLTIIALLSAALHLHAEDPSITVYQTIHREGLSPGKLMLQLNNPTDRPYYLLTGNSITDVQVNVEHLDRSGQWMPAPWMVCGRLWQLQRILPHSYLVFEAPDALRYNVPHFRIRLDLYTEFRPGGVPDDFRGIPHIDVYSPDLAMSDFRDLPVDLKSLGLSPPIWREDRKMLQ